MTVVYMHTNTVTGTRYVDDPTIFAIELASRDTIAIQSLDQGSADNYRVTLERLGPKGPQKCVLDIAVKAQSAASPSATPNPSLLAVNCTAVDAFHPSRSLVGN